MRLKSFDNRKYYRKKRYSKIEGLRVSAAAKLKGVDKTTIYRNLHRFNIAIYTNGPIRILPTKRFINWKMQSSRSNITSD